MNTYSDRSVIYRCVVLSAMLASILIAVRNPVSADEQKQTQDSQFVQKVFSDSDGDHAYSLFVPQEYTPDRQWPIVVFLHGAGERGNDGVTPTTVGLGPFLKDQSLAWPFLALFPQCEDMESRVLDSWNPDRPDGQRVYSILKAVEDEYSIDQERRILTGWSMGGYGTWLVAAAQPDMWAAVLPVSGGANPETAAKLKDVPVWAIHGQRDNVVRPSSARAAIDALQAADGSAWLTIDAQSGHDVWRKVYGNRQVYEWLSNPVVEGKALQLAEADTPVTDSDAPFNSVLEIPDAIAVRMDNRVLDGLSYAIPARVPASALSGSIPDIYDSTTAEGIRFGVTFSRISYSARLHQAHVTAVGSDRLKLEFDLQNIMLTIGATYVRGSGRSASAGPITVGIGHRRPVTLSIDVQPYVEDRRIRLKLVDSDFHIPYDNWYVTSPYGVSVSGWGMTRSRVANALVQGLYSRRSRIEREVGAAVPSILKWAEDTFDVADAGSAVATVWPLPVYQPRSQVWPQAVSVDKTGVSLSLGMSVESPTGDELEFRKYTVSQPASVNLQTDSELSLTVNPEILAPLSQLLVDSDAAHINVLDVPGDAFVELADRDSLLSVLPSLADTPELIEIRTELSLTEAMTLTAVAPSEISADDNEVNPHASLAGSVVQLNAPGLMLTIASGTADGWLPLGTFPVSVRQRVRIQVEHAEESSTIKLIPHGAADIAVSANLLADDAVSNEANHQADQLQALLTSGWNSWITGESFTESVISAIDFQQTRLQLTNLAVGNQLLVADFGIAPVIVENLSDGKLEYDVKGPVTGWGGPYVLEPGERHHYDDPFSLTYRQISPGPEVIYTLKPGSHSQFRVPRAGGPPALFRK